MNGCHVEGAFAFFALNKRTHSELIENKDRKWCNVLRDRAPAADLHVDVSPVVDQQLQTERAVGGHGSQVQGAEASLVGLVNIGTAVNQLICDCFLPHITGYMQSGVSKSVGLINLGVTNTNKNIQLDIISKKVPF